MLCELAKTFPPFVAAFLERERKLKRKFREETVTDMLMASLVGLEGLGVSVEFPTETATGGDMEWIYAAPMQHKGGSYLRLLIQAKRASYKPKTVRNKGDYWYYAHLEHNKGAQAQTLVNTAAAAPGTLALYAFYHPLSALSGGGTGLPTIEGVNFHEAIPIAAAINGGAKSGYLDGPTRKKVETWRPGFLSLKDLLCWDIVFTPTLNVGDPMRTQFIIGQNAGSTWEAHAEFHPQRVADRLNQRRFERRRTGVSDLPATEIEPIERIPPEILRAIRGTTTEEDRERLKRPRVVVWTDFIIDDDGELRWGRDR